MKIYSRANTSEKSIQTYQEVDMYNSTANKQFYTGEGDSVNGVRKSRDNYIYFHYNKSITKISKNDLNTYTDLKGNFYYHIDFDSLEEQTTSNFRVEKSTYNNCYRTNNKKY